MFSQYLEENVHKTYVDVDEMTQALMTRYGEYQRRKQVPFRILVEHGNCFAKVTHFEGAN
jgi:Nucleolin binding domain